MNIRNKQCACGSGKKHKRCCGDEAKLSEQRHEQNRQFMEKLRARAEKREAEEKRAEGTMRFGRRPPIPIGLLMALAGASAAFTGGAIPPRRR